MKKSTTEKVIATINKHNMIVEGDGIVVGLSGGPDSVCLFHVLCSLRERLGITRIVAVHVNHGLRGAESDGDQRYAAELAESLGCEFVSFNYDVAATAAAAGLGTEEAGRRLRYEAFEEVRKSKGLERVAVAHNSNDQAETILMRIIRGTGIKGLAGIPYTRDDGRIIRPILDLERSEIESYCEEHGLKPRIDSTNNEAIYTRNKIRLKLLPDIRENFNPNVSAALVRLGRQAAEDEDFIMQAAMAFLEEAWDSESSSLELKNFSSLHPSVAKRVLAECAARLGLSEGVSFIILEQLLALAASKASAKELDIAEGLYARSNYGKLWFGRRNLKSKVSESRRLNAKSNQKGSTAKSNFSESIVTISEQKSISQSSSKASAGTLDSNASTVTVGSATSAFEASISDANPSERDYFVIDLNLLERDRIIEAPGIRIRLLNEKSQDSSRDSRHTTSQDSRQDTRRDYQQDTPQDSPIGRFTVLLDFNSLKAQEFPIVIRCRRPGDRFRPKGMKQGSKKLQDYFTDRKIPKTMRDTYPLVAAGGRILAAGAAPSEDCRIAENGDSGLIVSIEY